VSITTGACAVCASARVDCCCCRSLVETAGVGAATADDADAVDDTAVDVDDVGDAAVDGAADDAVGDDPDVAAGEDDAGSLVAIVLLIRAKNDCFSVLLMCDARLTKSVNFTTS
jgi:hypothetical protein